MSSASAAERMLALFAGFRGAYGTHAVETEKRSSGPKQEIKKTARTIREPVTAQLWSLHLSGKKPIGIIPINEEMMCQWGCIDVDKYDLNHAKIAEQIKQQELPLVLCRSKSGGAHLFLFLEKPLPAANVQAKLKEIAASLGYGNCEIFPKQTEILIEKGDTGNWLNMPYLGGDKTNRYAVKTTGSAMTLTEFLRHAEKLRVAEKDFLALGSPAASRGKSSKKDTAFGDGPPCLEHLARLGLPEGTRNNGLFAMGVYCKRKWPSDWKNKLEDMNRRYMSPPLPADEVLLVVRSLSKRDYEYKCSEPPINAHCNSGVCRGREHGIGAGGDLPQISGLSVLDSNPRVWFLDIEGERIEMTTEDLQNYKNFHRLCMDKLHKCFPMIKQVTWFEILQGLMETVNKIDAPPDVSIESQFLEILEEFLTNRHKGNSREDILTGRPWEDEETGRHFFRMKDLEAHLASTRGLPDEIKKWKRTRLQKEIERLGGGHTRTTIKSKFRNLWYVPSSAVDQLPPPDVPKVERDPI